jgi:hypothetical protein
MPQPTKLDVPAGNGVGEATNISDELAIKQIAVSGKFRGSLTIEISHDDYYWNHIMSFSSSGINRTAISAPMMRVRRDGVPMIDAGHPDVFLESMSAAEQGPTGPQGAIGPQGATGATGPQGSTGPRGEQGIRGERGETGETGERGAIGVAGPAGAKGDVGARGPQGDIGPQGGIGPQGDVGARGEFGPTGAAGPVGPSGSFSAAPMLSPPPLRGTVRGWDPDGLTPSIRTIRVTTQGPAILASLVELEAGTLLAISVRRGSRLTLINDDQSSDPGQRLHLPDELNWDLVGGSSVLLFRDPDDGWCVWSIATDAFPDVVTRGGVVANAAQINGNVGITGELYAGGLNASLGWFGAGVHGPIMIDTKLVLDGPLFATDITITESGVLVPGKHPVCASGTLDLAGVIDVSGSDAHSSDGGVAGPFGIDGAGAGPTPGSPGEDAIGADHQPSAAYSPGGDGGSVNEFPGGLGSKPVRSDRHPYTIDRMLAPDVDGGGGGGSGASSGGSHVGGGGGGGGGVAVIAARRIVARATGVIRCGGGAGADGSGSGPGGACGGGAGAGGFAFILTNSQDLPKIDVAGGAGGKGRDAGTDGSDGARGAVIALSPIHGPLTER